MTKTETYRNRVETGFPRDPRSWRDLPAKLSSERLEIAGHPVMESWEGEYMKRLASIAASKPRRILEVGFGMGISAGFIQNYEIKEHVIIEANREVYDMLISFAKEVDQKVRPILGFWQDVTPTLPDESFSSILFDTYPLSEQEIHRNHFAFFSEAHRLLEKGGIFTYYSDEATGFSRSHRRALMRAGFRDIQDALCPVTPPPDCRYWKHDTLLVPVIFK
ncbi:MAG TPA: class I SAM-dependent methyltransferase [Thermoanaerobaculia bacterium]|nr:class I SAM-dependent methyltransferase [Thermoanaerobaculia bacterium]